MSVCAPSLNQISRMKLKNTTETSVLVGVYVVFQLAVLGSLLNTYSQSLSHPNSCGNGISWVPLHVYLSAFVSLSTLLALASAFITETHLDFTQRRQILFQNSSGTLISTNDEGIASGRSPGSAGSLSYKDYFSPYRVALCVYVLVSFVHLFNTSRRLFC